MKKLLLVLVIITFLIILIGCSSPSKANFIIKYTAYEPGAGEVLKWVFAEMVFYYGPNSEGEIVCIYTTDKDPTHGLVYKVVGKVLDVYFEGVVNYSTGEVNGKKLEYFDDRDDMLLYYP